jgi:phosphohistidine phosphatase
MHMLHLLRHAKASRKDEVEDHERGLTRRGAETARSVGRYLRGAAEPLDLVLASDSRRTRETLDFVLMELAMRPRPSIESELYLANAEQLLRRLQRLAEEERNVLVIGHNPGLQELALALADPAAAEFRLLSAGKFPTAAHIGFRVPGPWPELGRSRLRPESYVTPASLPGRAS